MRRGSINYRYDVRYDRTGNLEGNLTYRYCGLDLDNSDESVVLLSSGVECFFLFFFCSLRFVFVFRFMPAPQFN